MPPDFIDMPILQALGLESLKSALLLLSLNVLLGCLCAASSLDADSIDSQLALTPSDGFAMCSSSKSAMSCLPHNWQPETVN